MIFFQTAGCWGEYLFASSKCTPCRGFRTGKRATSPQIVMHGTSMSKEPILEIHFKFYGVDRFQIDEHQSWIAFWSESWCLRWFDLSIFFLSFRYEFQGRGIPHVFFWESRESLDPDQQTWHVTKPFLPFLKNHFNYAVPLVFGSHITWCLLIPESKKLILAWMGGFWAWHVWIGCWRLRQCLQQKNTCFF